MYVTIAPTVYIDLHTEYALLTFNSMSVILCVFPL